MVMVAAGSELTGTRGCAGLGGGRVGLGGGALAAALPFAPTPVSGPAAPLLAKVERKK